jgi:tripartite-type tricarboxylate transporter receptor subunit TctC
MTSSTLLRRAGGAVCASLFLSLAASGPVAAQAWPTRTITAIVPFGPGNAIDAVARVLMDQLSRQLGQTVVIENRAGAGGTIGATAVARSAPDGYTLLLYSSSFSISHSIHPNLPYDTLRDFIPVVPFGVQPTVLVTAPSKGFKTLGELVAAAKAKPGALSFASAGIGAASHMAAERFRVSAGFEALHIPFRGPTEALTATMQGQVDFYFLPIAAALPLITDGKLNALAVSTAKRASALPNVPTTTEAQGFGVRLLDRHVRAGENPQRDRRQAARRDANRARRADGEGPPRQDGHGAASAHHRGVCKILPHRRRRHRGAHQGGEDPDAGTELSGGPASPRSPTARAGRT